MDLTRLRPTASFLSSKARKQERISRSVTRLRSRIGACALAAAERDLGWTVLLRLPLTQLFALLSYSFPRLFAVLLHATLPWTPNKATGGYSAWNLAERLSLFAREVVAFSLRRWCTSILLFGPPLARGASSRNSRTGLGVRLEIGFCKGGLWVIPPIQSVS